MRNVIPTNRRARRKQAMFPTDPAESARAVGLRYVTGAGKGYSRKPAGKGFTFLDVDGKPIRSREELERIRSLVIPPAWTRVWICPSPNGHLQAIGYDARGRKQYRYHPEYRRFRDQTKFSRMPEFAKVLPLIRERVRRDLAKPGLPRDKVLATVVRLLETTCIRIGNVEYAKENSSFGLTTLRNRHVDVDGTTIRFHFRGKSGQDHDIECSDRRVARIVQQCQDLPGHELFQYLDEEGKRHSVDSNDVNEYLREITGSDFTAKDFRTWAGTVQAALELATLGPASSDTEGKRHLVAAVKNVAARLGNRPATCRKYYVHPVIFEAFLDTELFRHVKPPESGCIPAGDTLHPEEACVLALIRKRAGDVVQALSAA